MSALPAQDLFIDGSEVPPSSGRYMDDLAPIDDSLYRKVAMASQEDVTAAVDSAARAFLGYSQSTPSQRESWLLAAAELLDRRADRFKDILVDEIGSPIRKAERELSSSKNFLRAAAGACRQLSGKTLPTDVPGRLSLSMRVPLGVIASITPFNVPLIKGVKATAMPLATGNTVVLLTSEHAPVLGLELVKLLTDAGFPRGSVNLITGDGYEIGDCLTNHPAVQHVSFTGSTQVGQHVRQQCAVHGKSVTLEMGGKAPVVIREDADLQRALQGCIAGAFLYQGQICMAATRIYVHQDVYEEFLARFVTAAGQLKIGDLRNPAAIIGPIISPKQRKRIQQHIDDAITCGATVCLGGKWIGNCCQPTILSDLPLRARLCREETFGPVVAVYPFTSDEEAISLANDTDFGLTASVYTRDLDAGLRFSRELRGGMIHVNAPPIQEEPQVPFGGVGASGDGRESTDVDVAPWTQWRWITIQP